MTKALTRQEPNTFAPTTLTEAKEFGEMVASSSFAPQQYQGKPHDIVIAIQMGMELGLAPMQALQNIAVVNGRPSLWGDAALAVCRAHPECEDVVETYDSAAQVATCVVKRRRCEPTTRTFSVQDAKLAQLWGKRGPWTQYPQRMLQMRARGFALRDAFPDALRGLITREEAQDYPTPTPTPAAVTDTAPAALPPPVVEPEPVNNTQLLDEISLCDDKSELRRIYRQNEDTEIREACKARVTQLDAECDAERSRMAEQVMNVMREPGEEG
jgi:hypothetical protein